MINEELSKIFYKKYSVQERKDILDFLENSSVQELIEAEDLGEEDTEEDRLKLIKILKDLIEQNDN